MTFYENKGIWKSLLDVNTDQEDEDRANETTINSLHEAAAVSRFLSSEENVRPSLVRPFSFILNFQASLLWMIVTVIRRSMGSLL
jgi:hypothetical protein